MADLNEKALPCPFCGVVPRYYSPSAVICRTDGCACAFTPAGLSAWNTRAACVGAAPSAPSREAVEAAIDELAEAERGYMVDYARRDAARAAPLALYVPAIAELREAVDAAANDGCSLTLLPVNMDSVDAGLLLVVASDDGDWHGFPNEHPADALVRWHKEGK